MPSSPPGTALRLTAEERALLEDLGYEVRQNINGADIARASYHSDFVSPRLELAFVERVGEENARALDGVARLCGRLAARQLRRRFERGDYSLEPEEPAGPSRPRR